LFYQAKILKATEASKKIRLDTTKTNVKPHVSARKGPTKEPPAPPKPTRTLNKPVFP